MLTTCNDVIVTNIRIIAPETNPNTDGTDISGSKNVVIVKNSYIGTGMKIYFHHYNLILLNL